MGSEVNMAARLMGKAKAATILVSKKIFKTTRER
jgi:class 3 adenylate cyclase